MENDKKFCIHCGQVIDNDCAICPKCGKQVNNTSVSQNQGPQITTPPPITGKAKICKYCKSKIYKNAKVCPFCHKKQPNPTMYIIIGIVAVLAICYIFGEKKDPVANDESQNKDTLQSDQVTPSTETPDLGTEDISQPEVKSEEDFEKDKYKVGDTWENESLKVIYTSCYEFTDYNQYNAPADGNKIICLEFEFENIGKSDTTVMYTDFHGYADGYEVNQSYAPDGTGLDFTIKMSAGRKGTGKVAFEVPKDAQEVEIEFSPSFWSSQNIIFVYE